MRILLVAGVAVALGIVLLYPWRFRLEISFHWESLPQTSSGTRERGPRGELVFYVGYWRVLRLAIPPPAQRRRVRLPRIARAKKRPVPPPLGPREKWQQLRPWVRAGLKGARYLWRHTRVRELRWHTRVGLTDAAFAAIAAGIVETLQSGVALAAARARPAAPLQITTVVVFDRALVSTHLRCIFAYAPAYAIIAALVALGSVWRVSQENRGWRRVARTSHSRSHEDRHGEHP